MPEITKPHLFISGINSTESFKTTRLGGGNISLPERDRQVHGDALIQSLSTIWQNFEKELVYRTDLDLPTRHGEYLTFKSAADDTLSIESLDSSGAVLLKVSQDFETNQQTATIFIPEEQKGKLIKKVQNYLEKDKNEKPVNQKLIEKIEYVSRTSLEQLWSSDIQYLPKEEPLWSELWLATENLDKNQIVADLKAICNFYEIATNDSPIYFPQRTIVVVRANYEQLNNIIESFGFIAEIRKTEELNSFWLDGRLTENENWVNDALGLVEFTNTNNYISIMDTGVSSGHRLIAPALSDVNRLVVNPNWNILDGHGHGTMMAGVSLYGNLNAFLENNQPISIHHQLESLKFINLDDAHDYPDYPFVTSNIVNRAIINNPDAKRVYCMAVTTDFQVDFGKPSTYSSVMDSLAFGEDHDDKKLFLISVGNVKEKDDWTQYPENNLNLSVESPAQSWNSIGVGAYTQKTLPDQATLAQRFQLSPFSRTSVSWDSNWPIKPEVVFEGGNLILNENGTLESHDDLEVLTVSRHSLNRHFTTINATSAATAFAAHFTAKIRDAYPEAWPETLRALMIHSASWSQEMMDQFGFDFKKAKAGDINKLLRTVGYGIPDLQKAIECKTNYLTFVSEQIIKPYKKEGKKDIETNEIHYYEFPWPKEILENLESADVILKVTLSYFIEPNPGDKGYTSKYAYQSTALRFALIGPGEDLENFKIRTNRVSQDALKDSLGVEKLEAGAFSRNTANDRWALGADTVFKGSVHSNYWKGSAAEIASCNILAIYPLASGWWKQLKKQNKHDSELRYSLIVSIETSNLEVDIYTPIAIQVANEITVY